VPKDNYTFYCILGTICGESQECFEQKCLYANQTDVHNGPTNCSFEERECGFNELKCDNGSLMYEKFILEIALALLQSIVWLSHP